MKKIGIIANEFLPNFGGMESYAENLAKCFLAQGYEVHLFTRENASELFGVRSHKILNGNLLYDIPRLKKHDMDLWLGINSAYAVLALFKKNVFVIVHGNDFLKPWVTCNFPFFNAPLVWRWRERVEAGFLRWLLRASFPRASGIMANSRFTKRKFLEIFVLPPERVHVISPGIDASFLTEGAAVPRRPEEGWIFLAVSRLTKDNTRKNTRQVILALSELKAQYPFRYKVVGSGDDLDDIRDFARQHDMEDRVVFLGKQDRTSLRTIYRGADLFVMVPSVREKDVEGFGIVYVEANACGVPALASKGSGSEDAVRDGVTGYFVQEPTKNSLKEALRNFMDRKVQFDRATLVHYARGFTWDKVAARMVDEVITPAVQEWQNDK